MTIEKTTSGALAISDIVNGQRIHMQYMGYTLTEAKRLFKQRIKREKENETTKPTHQRRKSKAAL